MTAFDSKNIPTNGQLRVIFNQRFKFPRVDLVAPPRKPKDRSGTELPLDIIATTHGCYLIANPAFDSQIWSGKLIPTKRQLRVVIGQGFQFPRAVLVTPPRKPKDRSGAELLLDIIAKNHGCYFIENPAFDSKNPVYRNDFFSSNVSV